MYKLKIQNFADTYDPRAVMGERMFISETFPPTIATDQVLGVRSTPDLGGGANTVDATTITDIVEKSVEGLQSATEVEFTFALSSETMTKQLSFVGKEVFIYMERKNSTSDPTKLVEGTMIKCKLGGLTPTGQSSGNLEEFTQSGTQTSDEAYWCVPDTAGTTFSKITGLTSGADKTSEFVGEEMLRTMSAKTSESLNLKSK